LLIFQKKKILNVQSSDELACVIASVGLAQNFAALRALASEGILKGHLKLHAKNVAIMGGAKGNYIEVVASLMALDGNISTARAKQLLVEVCPIL
jgi:hydroxymethylglutaryl-CoA reductase